MTNTNDPGEAAVPATPIEPPVAEPVQSVCANCENGSGYVRHVGRDNDEIVEDCPNHVNPPPVPTGPVPVEGEPTLESIVSEHYGPGSPLARSGALAFAPVAAPAKAPLSPHALGCHCQPCLQWRVDGRVTSKPLWERMREDREALKKLLLGATIPGGALGTLARFRLHEDEARTLADQFAAAIRELADEKAAHDITRAAASSAIATENAMRAERDEQRGRADALAARVLDPTEYDGPATGIDLVDRLRGIYANALGGERRFGSSTINREAAAEIERLRGRVERAEAEVRAANQSFADLYDAMKAEVAQLRAKLEEKAAEARTYEGMWKSESLRTREGRQFLHRLAKYVREDRAVTPGVTRLARLADQVDAYLQRTNRPEDVLCDDEGSECNNQRCAQADAIKAAVADALGRAADGYVALMADEPPFIDMTPSKFEAWIRSGADAPGAGKP